MASKQNAVGQNLVYTNNADGYTIAGGDSPSRNISITGGDLEINAGITNIVGTTSGFFKINSNSLGAGNLYMGSGNTPVLSYSASTITIATPAESVSIPGSLSAGSTTLSGGLNIQYASPSLTFRNTATSNKQWEILGSGSNLVIRSDASTLSATFSSGNTTFHSSVTVIRSLYASAVATEDSPLNFYADGDPAGFNFGNQSFIEEAQNLQTTWQYNGATKVRLDHWSGDITTQGVITAQGYSGIRWSDLPSHSHSGTDSTIFRLDQGEQGDYPLSIIFGESDATLSFDWSGFRFTEHPLLVEQGLTSQGGLRVKGQPGGLFGFAAVEVDWELNQNATNAYGMLINAPTKSPLATITNAYGLYVRNPTQGINNYSAWFDGRVYASSIQVTTANIQNLDAYYVQSRSGEFRGGPSSVAGTFNYDYMYEFRWNFHQPVYAPYFFGSGENLTGIPKLSLANTFTNGVQRMKFLGVGPGLPNSYSTYLAQFGDDMGGTLDYNDSHVVAIGVASNNNDKYGAALLVGQAAIGPHLAVTWERDGVGLARIRTWGGGYPLYVDASVLRLNSSFNGSIITGRGTIHLNGEASINEPAHFAKAVDFNGYVSINSTKLDMRQTGRSTIHFGGAGEGVDYPWSSAHGLKIKLNGSSIDNTLYAGELGIGVEQSNIYFTTSVGYKFYTGGSLSSVAVNIQNNNMTVAGTVSAAAMTTTGVASFGGTVRGFRAIVGNTTLGLNESIFHINTASGSRTINLPTSTAAIGQEYYLTLIDTNPNATITFDAGANGYIHGGPTNYGQTQVFDAFPAHRWWKLIKIAAQTWSMDSGVYGGFIQPADTGSIVIASGTRGGDEAVFVGTNPRPVFLLLSYAQDGTTYSAAAGGGALYYEHNGGSIYIYTTNPVSRNVTVHWRRYYF